MNQGNQVRVYVGVDELIDVRYNILSQIAPNIASMVLGDWYHTRTIDKFGRPGTELTDERYEEAYRNRTVAALKGAMMTQLPLYMVNLISKYTLTQGKPLLASSIKVTVNIYPYDIEDEYQATLGQAIRFYTNDLADVELVSIPTDQLTVKMIQDMFDVVFMYDFNNWLMMHKDEFERTQAVETVLITPRLMLAQADREIIDRAKAEGTGYEATSILLQAFITVKFVDVRLFSIVTDTPPDLTL